MSVGRPGPPGERKVSPELIGILKIGVTLTRTKIDTTREHARGTRRGELRAARRAPHAPQCRKPPERLDRQDGDDDH